MAVHSNRQVSGRLAIVHARHWTVVDMKADWKRIFRTGE